MKHYMNLPNNLKENQKLRVRIIELKVKNCYNKEICNYV
jgi:hypothetical protein